MMRRMSTGFIPLSTSAENRNQCSDAPSTPDGSAGLRAFMCSVESERCASRDRLRSIVVTPDSIPQFTIPKLVLGKTQDRETQPGDDMAWKLTEDLTNSLHLSSSSVSSSSSSSSLFCSSPAPGRKAQRSISDPNNCRQTSVNCTPSPFMESDQCSDPATRGALSLPHLAKITTPYGFITLSQSPQMANEEELFLQIGYRSWARDKKNMPLRKEMESNSSGRTLPVQSHTDALGCQVSRGISKSETTMSSGSFPSPATASRPKQSFWGVLRKHISSRQLTKSI